ncbi:MAG TPA: phosphatidylglycerol lysyltransferase domain-containing protein [Verrucomicrobiae bacterium]|nr:phosphatidylglycerol lysyltransferase domain-containing protein [Verrucomicrobiae bacterium]
MQTSRRSLLLTRLVAYFVLTYGAAIIADALLRQLRIHHGHQLDVLLITVPQVAGLGFMYLGTLLLRRKYNAWLMTMVLLTASLVLDMWHGVLYPRVHDPGQLERLLLTILLLVTLWLTRGAFRVRSDMRTFQQAIWVSALVLGVAFLYGIGGFMLLDDHDFHQEISLTSAAHQTVDQFGLTEDHAVAYTRRARLFVDSLSVLSVAAVGYAAISFFEPIRVALSSQTVQRAKTSRLLDHYPSDLDDYFKLWPHDKLYYFDVSGEAGIAYHVARGVALVAGNPFGDPKCFSTLLDSFIELCFVNDWLPAFIHVDGLHRTLFTKHGFRLQEIGEEAVLNVPAFATAARSKYFRQINNRFTKLGYNVEVIQPPYDIAVLTRLRDISDEWLGRPGRAERGFMLGYFNDEYIQQCPLALLYDGDKHIQGFMNLVPTFESNTANYDLLRCANAAPGNANDFLMLGTIDYLHGESVQIFNLGLCPLSGVDEPDSDETTLIDRALRFVYSNGDRFYSFSGLKRFKAKYEPSWEPRFIAYPGGVRNFTRILTALNRVMKVK